MSIHMVFRRAFARHPEPWTGLVAVALLVGACGGSDSSGDPSGGGGSGNSGTASGAGSATSASSTGGSASSTPTCDVRDLVCVASCPTERGAAICGAEDCAAGFVSAFSCDPQTASLTACAAGTARKDAFCVRTCPATTPGTCDQGTPHCPSGTYPLHQCAGS
jgi:hypothetical protein